MVNNITFVQARALVDQRLAQLPDLPWTTGRRSTAPEGRDLGDSWAFFLQITFDDGRTEPLIGAPVLIVNKTSGDISVAQIPPHFEILEAKPVDG